MSIVKARYWTHYDSGAQFVDVTDLNDLIIAPVVPIGATKNIEIYVKHIEGSFDLDFVSPPTNGYQSIEVVQTDERGTIDGLEYNALVYVKVLYNPFNIKTAGSVSKAYFLWDDLWSNKSIPIKFRFTSTSGITINKDFTATYGLTARAYIDDDAPMSMSNMPNNSIQITALAEIADVFNNHATYGYYPVNGAENIITGEWSFSDAQTQPNVHIEYDGEIDGIYTISNPWDTTSLAPLPRIQGSMTLTLNLEAPWYPLPYKHVVLFEKYLNFFSTVPDTTDYVLGDLEIGYEFWSDQSYIAQNGSHSHAFSSNPISTASGTLYYITFRVTIMDDGFTEIRRITPNDLIGISTDVYFGGDSSGYAHQCNFSDNSFSESDIDNEDCIYYGTTTLVANRSSQSVQNSFKHTHASPTVGRVTYDWNLLEGLANGSVLDEYPIWHNLWTP